MIWLIWRQHRAQLLAGAALLGGIGVFLLLTGIGMRSSFTDSGLAACLATTPDACSSLAGEWSSQYSGYQFLIPLFLVVPALIGVFWGSPLVSRELEQGTHRMVWMQSVTRTRWLLFKFGGLVTAAIVASALLTVALEWWSNPLITATGNGRIVPGVFDLLGVVPVSYAVFAFALGVTAGVVMRKSIPAMGVTLLGYAAVRVVVEFFLRPNFQQPMRYSYSLATTPMTKQTGPVGDWQLSAQTLDRAGHLISNGVGIDYNLIVRDCPNLALPTDAVPNPTTLQACIHDAGVYVVANYQPANRYWPFQWIEFALFIGLAAALVAAAFWWVRRRTS